MPEPTQEVLNRARAVALAAGCRSMVESTLDRTEETAGKAFRQADRSALADAMTELLVERLTPEEHSAPDLFAWIATLVPRISEGDRTVTDRGFAFQAPTDTKYGHVVRVSESSSASGPHVWLGAERTREAGEALGFTDPEESARVHMTADQAVDVAMALLGTVWHHYQGRPA